MKVISTTDLSREGNDCYIYESVSLVEAFGMYSIIRAEKVAGYWGSKDIGCTLATNDLYEAKQMYKEYGGIFVE